MGQPSGAAPSFRWTTAWKSMAHAIFETVSIFLWCHFDDKFLSCRSSISAHTHLYVEQKHLPWFNPYSWITEGKRVCNFKLYSLLIMCIFLTCSLKLKILIWLESSFKAAISILYPLNFSSISVTFSLWDSCLTILD